MTSKFINIVSLVFLSLMSGIHHQANANVKTASPFGDHMVLQQQKPVSVWGWADAGESVTVSFNGWKGSVTAAEDGRWSIVIPAMKYGGPYEMTVSGKNTITFKDVYLGEVWLCSGQSNMVMTVAREDRYWCGVFNEDYEVAHANYPKIRAYTVDLAFSDSPLYECNGKWEVISPATVGHISALSYFFARELYEKYKIPVGLVVSAYGASTVEAWTREDVQTSNDRLGYLVSNYKEKCEDYDIGHAQGRYLKAVEEWEAQGAEQSGKRKPSAPKNPHTDQHNPAVLWNAMMNPLVPYTIRGFLWYQGESNSGTTAIYREQMEVMIKDWRTLWKEGDLPFYYVQLANREKLETVPAQGHPDALNREAQLQALALRNTGMVVAIDNADPDDPINVHPKNKQEIGRRMALIARANVYGEKKLEYSGPLFSGVEFNGNRAIISFTHVGKGLEARSASGKLEGFAVAGEDGVFHWGDARIEGDKVVVTCSEVPCPTIVNYGFGRNPITSLYNKDGLPASPFRTNDQ